MWNFFHHPFWPLSIVDCSAIDAKYSPQHSVQIAKTYILAKLGANASTFAISTARTIFEAQPHSRDTRSARWFTTGRARETLASVCTSPRTKGWKRYKRSTASKASIPGECCTVDHIDLRFKIVPQLCSCYLILKSCFIVYSSDEGDISPRMRMLTDATANEPSNAASKNGVSQPNTTLPTEVRTWLPESASYGRSTPPTSRC